MRSTAKASASAARTRRARPLRARCRSSTGRTTSRTTRSGIKSEWLDKRLQFNLSAFLMKWDDIQVHFNSTSGGNGGAFWIEGNINGGKAEQKGVEFSGEWKATERLNFAWSAFFATPEFTEDTLVPNSDLRGLHRQGHDVARLAEGEVLGLGRVHVPRNSCRWRAMSGRGSRTTGRARPGDSLTRSRTTTASS